MKRTFYHGTSADNLPSILKNGLSCSEIKLWSCSNDETYLWSVDKVMEAEDLEDEDEAQNYAFRFANESAQCACVYSNDCRLVVLKIELEEKEVYPDRSCENMEGRGCVCIDRNILPSEIVEIKVSNDLSLLKGYFISLMLTNDYFNLDDLTPLQLKIAKALQGAELYPEDVEDVTEWHEVSINELQNS